MRNSRLTPDYNRADESASVRALPQTFAVMSGKGGVGKSIVAHNLALAFGDSGQRTLLVDLDWRLGNQRILSNSHSSRSLNDVVFSKATLESSVAKIHDNVFLLAPATPDSDVDELTESAISEYVRRSVIEANSYDIVVYDTGSGLSKELVELAQIVDSTILTLTPELTAISDCYALYKWLLQTGTNVSASLVINRAAGPDEATDLAERFVLLTSKFLDRKPQVIGYLSEDKAVRESVARQRSLFAGDPRPQIAAQFTRLAGRLSAMSISRTDAQRMSSLRSEVNLKA